MYKSGVHLFVCMYVNSETSLSRIGSLNSNSVGGGVRNGSPLTYGRGMGIKLLSIPVMEHVGYIAGTVDYQTKLLLKGIKVM